MASKDVPKGLRGRSQGSNSASAPKNASTSATNGPLTRAQRAQYTIQFQEPPKQPPKSSPPTASEKQIDSLQALEGQQPTRHGNRHPKQQRQQQQEEEELPKLQLSKKNLGQLQSQLSNSTSGSRKKDTERTGSESDHSAVRQESTIMTTSTVASASYRFETLRKVMIFVQMVTLPENIQLQVNAIFNRDISSGISAIAKSMCLAVMGRMQSNIQEDNYVEVIIAGLEELDKEDAFCFTRKCKWDEKLQPNAQTFPPLFNPEDLVQVGDEINGSAERPRKRQRRDSPADESLENSASKPDEHRTGAKGPCVPCSDCTIGLQTSTWAQALSKHGVSVWKATIFMLGLENSNAIQLHPSKSALNYRFPNIVIEGKAYTTGRTPFEAENQAAVSGSYMINALQRFADSYDQFVPNGSLRRKGTPLVFSITSCGPLIQLWVHYALVTDDTTSYHMNILKSCHACVISEMEAFLSMVDQIMSWNKDEVLPEMTSQLVELAKAQGL